MHASVRGTRIYFDVEGAGLVPDGASMRQKPEAMVIHGGPGGDHSGFKPALSPLSETMQLVYFDHRGQGRSDRGDPERYTLCRGHGGAAAPSRARQDRQHRHELWRDGRDG